MNKGEQKDTKAETDKKFCQHILAKAAKSKHSQL